MGDDHKKQRIFGPSVFVGNIPYGVHEGQIIEWLANVGTVTNFRLIDDHQTKQSKGYGFATFADQDTAEAAIRNLNGAEWNGRQIKVDWPNATDKDMLSRQAGVPSGGAQQSTPLQAPAPPSLPPLPPGTDLGPNLTAEDAISKTLAALPATQLLDILMQMQGLVQQDPARAQVLLEQSPQLSYAIFQALLKLQLVDNQTLNSIIASTTTAPPPVQPPPQVPQAPPAAQVYPPQGLPQHPPQVFPPPPPQQYGQLAPQPGFPPTGTPQQFQQPYQQPPQQAPPPPQATPSLLAGAGNRDQLVQTLLSMTPDQIRGLGASPQETEQLLAVWAQLRQGQVR